MLGRVSLQFVFVTLLIKVDSQRVTLYFGNDKTGSFSVKDLTGHLCIPNLEDKVYSVDTYGGCIKFYKDKHCCGESIEMSSTGEHFKNSPFSDGIVIGSISKCKNPCSLWRNPKTSISVTLYRNELFEGTNVSLDLRKGCKNVPTSLKNHVKSVKTDEVCVKLYKQQNCLGKSYSIQPSNPVQFKNSRFWSGFDDNFESVSSCDYQCPHSTIADESLRNSPEDAKMITIFHEPCFLGDFYEHIEIRNGQCTPVYWDPPVKSIRTYGNCFIVYKSPDCKGSHTILSDLKPNEDVQNVPLEQIRSIETCPIVESSPRADEHEMSPSYKMGTLDLLLIIGLFLVLLIIAIIICYCYMMRKQKGDNTPVLTDMEIMEFKSGVLTEQQDEDAEFTQNQVYSKPYDTVYEMSRSTIIIDFRSKLGTGRYSQVYKGNMGYNSNLSVAVKTLKRNSDVEYLKILLKEIKIMIYNGHHSHIVDFLGCCTENLHRGEIYIIMELCPNGPLDKYLHRHAPAFQDLLQGNSNNISESCLYRGLDGGSEYFLFNTFQLMRWILQITEGINHLASKKIVHGDLATRNILLDSQYNAKVSYFGLSKQVYQFSEYVKRNQVPLTWRWLSIESLNSLHFSVESDIWSFGILMWEVFSLGEIPYPGMIWTDMFKKKLEDGLRPLKPQFSTVNHYTIMLDCWKEDPSERPSFPILRTRLQKVYADSIKHQHKKHLHTSIYNAPHLPGISE